MKERSLLSGLCVLTGNAIAPTGFRVYAELFGARQQKSVWTYPLYCASRAIGKTLTGLLWLSNRV